MREFYKRSGAGWAIAIILFGIFSLVCQINGCATTSKRTGQRAFYAALGQHPDSTVSGSAANAAGLTVRQMIEFAPSELDPHVADSLSYKLIQREPKVSVNLGGVPTNVYVCTSPEQLSTMMSAITECSKLNAGQWLMHSSTDTVFTKAFGPLNFSHRPVGEFVLKVNALKEADARSNEFGVFGVTDFLHQHPGLSAGIYLGRMTDRDLPPLHEPLYPKWAWWVTWIVVSFLIVFSSMVSEQWNHDIEWGEVGSILTVLLFLPGWAVGFFFMAIDWIIKKFKCLMSANVGRAVQAAIQLRQVNAPVPQPVAVATNAPRAVVPNTVGPWYFIAGIENKYKAFMAAGIPCNPLRVDIGEADAEHGLVFPASSNDAVMSFLGVTYSLDRLEATGRTGIFRIPFDPRSKEREQRSKEFASRRPVVREAYVALAQQRLQHELADARRRRAEITAERDKAQRTLVENLRQESFLAQREEVIRQAMTEQFSPAWLGQEFDKLCNHPDVKWVDINPTGIRVYTHLLYGEEEWHDGLHYFELGEFEIVIRPDGVIRMNNLTHRRGSKDHPGLIEGTGCMGNLTDGLSIRLARYEYAQVIQMLIAFLTRDSRGGFASGGWKEVPHADATRRLAATNESGNTGIVTAADSALRPATA